jgi:hypothetical protein
LLTVNETFLHLIEVINTAEDDFDEMDGFYTALLLEEPDPEIKIEENTCFIDNTLNFIKLSVLSKSFVLLS